MNCCTNMLAMINTIKEKNLIVRSIDGNIISDSDYDKITDIINPDSINSSVESININLVFSKRYFVSRDGIELIYIDELENIPNNLELTGIINNTVCANKLFYKKNKKIDKNNNYRYTYCYLNDLINYKDIVINYIKYYKNFNQIDFIIILRKYKNDNEIVNKLVKIKHFRFNHIKDSLEINDPNFVIPIIDNCQDLFENNMPINIKNNREINIYVLKKYNIYLSCMLNIYMNDTEILTIIALQNPDKFQLYYVPYSTMNSQNTDLQYIDCQNIDYHYRENTENIQDIQDIDYHNVENIQDMDNHNTENIDNTENTENTENHNTENHNTEN